ncbi:MAG: hypothetical protein MK180_18770, partial [Rhodobacteraceae bacterium]|nr:hypothetical protein [Paracoccaceae bacterium]
MADLPRLKPDPIPTIHPVPEFAVSGARAAVYERTKKGLGVPWMGVVAMAFAHYPRFYDTLWSAVEPISGTKVFRQACQSMRDVAEREAEALEPAPLVSRLSAQGYPSCFISQLKTGASSPPLAHGLSTTCSAQRL